MGMEIERKFLVREHSFLSDLSGTAYVQGYLSHQVQGTIRVRRAGDKGFLTIKSPVQGMTRHEFEYEIPLADATQILELFCDRLIEKTRYLVPFEGKTWEVDVFSGANEGLVMAEVELEDEDEDVALPDWAGMEVTYDKRYFNSWLISNPWPEWKGG